MTRTRFIKPKQQPNDGPMLRLQVRGMPSHWPTVTSSAAAEKSSINKREIAAETVALFVAHCQEGGATGNWEINELYEWFVEWCFFERRAIDEAAGTSAISARTFQTALTSMGIKSERKCQRINGKNVGVRYRNIPELITLRLAA